MCNRDRRIIEEVEIKASIAYAELHIDTYRIKKETN